MIAVIIVIITATVGFFLLDDDLGCRLFGSFLGFLVGVALSTFIMMPVDIFGNKAGDWTDAGYIPIVSIKPASEVHGAFCIGTGYIGTTQYYFAMRKLSNDSYKPIKIEVSDIESINESNENPKFLIYKQEVRNKMMHYLFWKNSELQRTNYKYKLVVPKGTVIQDFKVQ